MEKQILRKCMSLTLNIVSLGYCKRADICSRAGETGVNEDAYLGYEYT